MKKLLLAKLAAGLFELGVCGMFTSAQAVPTFTFSPLDGGNKTLLTLSGQTQDRSDTVPDLLGNGRQYNQMYDGLLENFITTEPITWSDNNGHHIDYLSFSFTEGLEDLTVTSTLRWDPRPDVPPEFIPPEPAGFPKTITLSPVTYLFIADDGPPGDIPQDDFILRFTTENMVDPDLGSLSPLLFSETLSFSGSAILDMDFSQFNVGTYRGQYLGQPLNPAESRITLESPTFDIVVTPEPTSLVLLTIGGTAILRRRRP